MSKPHRHRYNKKEMIEFLENRDFCMPKDIFVFFEFGKTPQNLKVIKERYKKLAREYHPDMYADKDKDTIDYYTQKFQELNSAYEFLKGNYKT